MADLTDAELDRLVERNNRYIASLRGENELKCGNGMASFALEESTTAITALRARIAELEQRLEIDPAHPYDGIETRDATIIALETYKENLRDEVVELRAKIAELEAFQQQAITQVCKLAREAGEAKGKLEASELPGIVDGWREKCERLERRVAELEKERSQG